MARPRQQLTDTEREQRRTAQRRELEHALEALLTSDGWRRWLRTRATLHAYSANNTLLIASQAWARGITPTHVAGFRAWLKLGRAVRKGERGLSIWAPMRIKARDEAGEETAKRTLFRVAKVFDVCQTDPLPGVEAAPLSPPSAPVEGDTHAHLLQPLEQFAQGLGYTVVWSAEIAGGAKGLCRRRQREIEVLTTIAPNYRVAVLVHELCHALVGERGELAAIDYALEEIVVESATYVACAAAGLATDVDSVPYVAGWAGDQDPLAVLAQAAGLIDELARLIEDAISPAADPDGDDPDVESAVAFAGPAGGAA